MITRRAFAFGGLAMGLAVSGCMSSTGVQPLGYQPVQALTPSSPEPYNVAPPDINAIPIEYRRQRVRAPAGYDVGTIVVDTNKRFLYLIQDDGSAIRYGIGVGREGMSWSGTATIKRKAKWPTWTPPQSMIEREPELVKYAGGMPGGPNNPLGARALYLYEGGRDTLYRIHGTREARSIGHAVSSGCIRLLNTDVIDLYQRVPIGTKVVVLQHVGAAA
ncbi:L,D-transpeptidase [Amorphus orientalis]|uniref:Lipoprotein-anchoring transpeptidase ErfK/SrfK n=1 Tax=Amorphus orientalis TaxID=649198 RepID=A0AAE4AVB7_9HYPH|nr:L,D-transpeptidase [Amorphus orientalis]MDQ0316529.1 lipoprotein-anchoring transpeptidase ErfK/SrfK [Amorphus orientalis]